jgi:arginine deiminase
MTGSPTAGYGVTSEVGRLRTVMLHRPGAELQRLTPRNSAGLLFDGIPWVERAQVEHDLFAEALRSRGVEVLILRDLLVESLEVAAARDEVVEATLADPRLGTELRRAAGRYLDDLDAGELADVLAGGLAHEELRGGSGIAWQLMDRHDFVIPPLPNLLFTRDSAVWLGRQVAVTSPSMPARRRETWLTEAIYRNHPRFAGAERLYSHEDEWLEGGDVLLLAPGVVAIGVTSGTSPAGLERLARGALNAGLAQTVLAVRVRDQLVGPRLDTVCTLVDTGTVIMNPQLAYTLTAHTITARGGQLQISRPQPFLEAAARALGRERLTVIGTGLDPVTGRGGQWDDGGNALALAPGLVVCQERAA